MTKFSFQGYEITLEYYSENALLLSWPEQVCSVMHQSITQLQQLLASQLARYTIDMVASYNCLMVYYHFQDISAQELSEKIQALVSQQQNILKHTSTTKSTTVTIPVYYDLEEQWDLKAVAQRCQLSVEQVIQLHSEPLYHSFALGFTPGFCYLATVPTQLQLPRRATPRLKVPQGAVAIAEQQTAVYPHQSPGGWHIIGLTPMAMYDFSQQTFSPKIKVGDKVQFQAIDKQSYQVLVNQQVKSEYSS